MPALLLLSRNTASLPLLTLAMGAISRDISEMAGIGPIPGGFFFAFIEKNNPSHLVKAEERTLEKGVQFHDHAQDRGSVIELVVHLHGSYEQRNIMYQVLKFIREELRKEPGSLVTSDPLEIFPAVVLEVFDVETDRDIFYDMKGKTRAWFIATLRFRLINIVGDQRGRVPGGQASSGSYEGTRSLGPNIFTP